jgi:hypothetical protein
MTTRHETRDDGYQRISNLRFSAGYATILLVRCGVRTATYTLARVATSKANVRTAHLNGYNSRGRGPSHLLCSAKWVFRFIGRSSYAYRARYEELSAARSTCNAF